MNADVSEIASELQALQRTRVWHMKTCRMNENRLWATVAGSLGYYSGMREAERKRLWGEARKLVRQIVAGEVSSPLAGIVLTVAPAIQSWRLTVAELEKAMVQLAEQLPVAQWVQQPEQRGFGMLGLAIVVGECGDLNNYDCPSKVWRRMSCAPYTKDGETLMGSTWRRRICSKRGETKLSGEDWEEYGFSPRRRSVSYLIGEALMKQNGNGPYRRKYDRVKASVPETHPDWMVCPKCQGQGKNGSFRCENCDGKGIVWMHAHRHAMLLATKLLLLNLWLEWTGQPRTEWRPRA